MSVLILFGKIMLGFASEVTVYFKHDKLCQYSFCLGEVMLGFANDIT